ncbi:MAG: hypothetical protein KDA22_13925 [Phycisphaerales bacterium]|nr:hypothetical protein [Phycisphaerales bacterium]
MSHRIRCITLGGGLAAIALTGSLNAQVGGLTPVDPWAGEGMRTHAPTTASTPTEAVSLPEMISGWETLPGEPVMPVFDAGVVYRRGWTALLGGINGDFAVVSVIQIHDPVAGWLPISSQLLEPRARATTTVLEDGRVLVVGGVAGTLGGELHPLATCEVVDPFVAGSARAVPRLDEPLVGHSAHRLGDGSVVVVGGHAARRFDPRSLAWTERISLARPRTEHASAALPDGRIIVIGGDVDTLGGATIETVEPARGTSTLWSATLERPTTCSSAVCLDDGRILVVGGLDERAGRTTSRCWLLDPERQTVTAGPSLPLVHGVACAAVFPDRLGAVIVGGEWRNGEERGEPHAAYLFQAGEPGGRLGDRLWRLAEMPEGGCRGQWHRRRNGRLAVQGGYAYLDEEQARLRQTLPGPKVSGALYELWIADLGRQAD